jgi:lipid A 3-O-deacylase
MKRTLLAIVLLSCSTTFAAKPELGLVFARSTKSNETDIVRLTYRYPLLRSQEWWMPESLQLGVSAWRVPDIGGSTQRLDLNATPIWRLEQSWWYVEGGIGAYLLSKTINNDANRLPSSFQFGSHIGAGVRVGENGRIGVALQHLSNAGLKQPNGGIDLVQISGGILF